jgi:RNA polymerase sigma-70 factor, ECF subfamily
VSEPKAPTDEALVALAGHGQPEAFEELVRRHRDQVYRVAYRLLRDPQLAEDVEQEVFVAAWRALPRFRADAQFSTWVYRIATNTALNYARHRREFAAPFVNPPVTTLGAGADLVAEHNERVAGVAAVIASLPFEQRAALVLRSFEQCTYAEVADILGITVPAVRGRLHRARREVARSLMQSP